MIPRLRDVSRKNAAGLVPAEVERRREMYSESRDWRIGIDLSLTAVARHVDRCYRAIYIPQRSGERLESLTAKIKGRVLRAPLSTNICVICRRVTLLQRDRKVGKTQTFALIYLLSSGTFVPSLAFFNIILRND